jgi:hypothetical protein
LQQPAVLSASLAATQQPSAGRALARLCGYTANRLQFLLTRRVHEVLAAVLAVELDVGMSGCEHALNMLGTPG